MAFFGSSVCTVPAVCVKQLRPTCNIVTEKHSTGDIPETTENIFDMKTSSVIPVECHILMYYLIPLLNTLKDRQGKLSRSFSKTKLQTCFLSHSPPRNTSAISRQRSGTRTSPSPNLTNQNVWIVFTARCTLVQSAVLRTHVVCLSLRLSVRLSVCPSVTLVDCDHIGWNSSKIISPLAWDVRSFQPQHDGSAPRGTRLNLGTKWPTPCWFERRRHSIANCGWMVTDSATVTMESL